MTVTNRKPIVCLDFDGVIHDYREGWKDGSIYGNVMPGFFEWAEEAYKHFTLVIYSSRSKTPAGVEAMREWLWKKHAYWLKDNGDGLELRNAASMFEFAHEKPPAFLTIDDRAVTFGGDWTAGCLQPRDLMHFKTWSQK